MRAVAVLTAAVGAVISWKAGSWLGDLTYDRWHKHRTNGLP